jgi:SH3-like domain-containing protein
MASAMRLLLLACLIATPAVAAPADPAQACKDALSGLGVPRFVSLKPGKAFVRAGPGDQYPVLWVYVRRGLPLEVLKEYCIWRQVRDESGQVGWINKSLLQSDRLALVTRSVRVLYARPDLASPPVYRIEAGALVGLTLCEGDWCRVARDGKGGYMLRSQLWGTYPGERIEG